MEAKYAQLAIILYVDNAKTYAILNFVIPSNRNSTKIRSSAKNVDILVKEEKNA
jgi:hypothetical protein